MWAAWQLLSYPDIEAVYTVSFTVHILSVPDLLKKITEVAYSHYKDETIIKVAVYFSPLKD